MDVLFIRLFQNKKDLLSLYNALNGSDYTDENQLYINTLEDLIYISVKNDVSLLADYAYFISRIRYYNTEKSYSIEQAVDTACMECIKKDILRNFLLKNRSEVMDMFMVDYNPSLLREMDREEGYEDGFADGETAGFSKGESAGFSKGESVGFSKGESVGFKKGELESKKQIIKNMLAHGMTDNEIMTLTGCPKKLIESLQK